MKGFQFRRLCVLGPLVLLAGCTNQAPVSPPQTNLVKPDPSKHKFYWVQVLKNYPVHQLTQTAFKEGCKKLGYECEIIGTENHDVAGTLALADQALARGDAAGFAVWAGQPEYNAFIEKAGKAGLPVILPHFPAPEYSIPGASGIISADPNQYSEVVADEIGKAIGGKGTVALTQGSVNSTENMAANAFAKTMHDKYPQVTVLKPEEEGFDAPSAIANAVSILKAHPDVVAAFSTTGNGATTWAGAQRETGRKIVVIGMDYTRVNLDDIKNGKVHAVIGQPLWEESYGAAELLDKLAHGQRISWWTKLPAPLITKDKLNPYYALLEKVEAAATYSK